MDQITNMLKDQKSIDGESLFQHLSNLIHKIVNEPNKYAEKMETFEILSDFIKKNSFKYKNPRSDSEVNNIPIVIGEHDQWVEKSLKLIKDYKNIRDIHPLRFPNFDADSKLLENCGVYFGEDESYKICMSLKRLAQTSQAKELRFWGKILTLDKDYYIAEGVISAEQQFYSDEPPRDSEKKGTGANSYTHFVTHDILGEWYELPFVTPQQVRSTQKIKYIFTGNLNNQINAYPPFEGKEKHFLKAQITRISHACTLVPKELYKPADEPPTDIVFNEEPFKMITDYTELKALTTWQHLHPYLHKQGRCSLYVDKNLPQEEQDQLKEKLEADDPPVERLKDVGEEKGPFPPEKEEEVENPNWNVREYGDTQQFTQAEGSVCYSTVAFKNLTWQGAMLITSLKGWVNIYVGYGLKTNQKMMQPIQPDDIAEDIEDLKDEEEEPNPKKPVENIEKDSDKGDKPEDEEEEI